MRVVITALMMLLAFAGFAISQDAPAAAPEVDYLVCDYSGSRWDTSSTRIEVTVTKDEVESAYHFTSLYNMMMFIIDASIAGNDVGDLGEFKMLDYDAFGKDEPVWIISGGDAPPEMFVVYLEDKEFPGSEEPYLAAFISEDSANAKAKEWGGEVYDAEAAMGVLEGIIEAEMEARFAEEPPAGIAPPEQE